MTKKKILIFIDWYLPGFKAGGPVQSIANLVSHLKKDFEISVITSDTDYSEQMPYTTIQSDQWNDQNGTRVYYISKKRLHYSTIQQLIKNENPDCIYLNGIYSMYFTLMPLFISRNTKISVIVAARGMLSKGSLQVKRTKKTLFLFFVKYMQLFNKVIFHATTEIEYKEIRDVFGNKVPVKIAANLPALQPLTEWTVRKKDPGKVCLINVARIAPEKNLLLALKILQQVKTSVEFDFYGPVYDVPYWDECKKVMAALPSNITATYKGSIEPHQVISRLKTAHFLFMPTSGENFGHIILQAFTAGTPVIISDQTPWKNLEQKHCGWDLSLRHSEKFVSLIDNVAGMPQTAYNRLSKAAVDYAVSYISNPEMVLENRALFN